MDRKEKILSMINRLGKGIEIGPSHSPIASKREGFNVEIIDHASQDELKQKFQEHDVHLENIEPVDYVWTGQSYFELTGKAEYYDWIIASHVIEHTPDVITFLLDCSSLLKEDGVLSLAVPDSRYCFDQFRPISGISKVLDAYFNRHKMHTPGTIAEFHLNISKKNGQIAWGKGVTGKNELMFADSYAKAQMSQALRNEAYIDAHAWCFTPSSFRLLINDLCQLDICPLKESRFYPTEGCEFFISLSKSGGGIKMDRMKMLESIQDELCEAYSVKIPAKNIQPLRSNLIHMKYAKAFENIKR